jgi:hypothetical protein
VRYYFWGILAYFFRNEVRRMIDWLGEHLLIALGVLLAAAILFLVARWLIVRSKSQSAKGKTAVSYTD